MKIKNIVLAGIISLVFSVHASDKQNIKRDPIPYLGYDAVTSNMCIDAGGLTDPVEMRTGDMFFRQVQTAYPTNQNQIGRAHV